MWRVSTILSISGLSTPRQFSPEARDRGTAVHTIAEGFALGKSFDFAIEHEPYADALAAWFRDFKPQTLFTERRITNREKRITGRVDYGCILPDGDHTIVDFKTGSPAPSHGIQVSGYCDLANDDKELTELLLKHTFGPWSRAILYLKDNGKYDWRGPIRLLQDGPQDTYLWRSAHSLVCWRFDHGLLSITDSENPDDDRLVAAI